MPVIEFGDRDLMRGKIVSPGWYRVRIEAVGEQPTTTDKGPSTNFPVEGTVLFNGDTGDTEYANVPVDWNFNSKAIGFATGFLKSFGVEVKSNTRYDLKSAEGREVDMFIGNKTYNNRIVHDVTHQYRTPRADVTAVVK